MERKRFRAVLAAVTMLTAGAFVAPSAVAALGGERSVAPLATSQSGKVTPRLEAPDGDGDDDDNRGGKPSSGPHKDDHKGDKSCLYPPSDRPKLTLFDPNKQYKKQADIIFEGTAKIKKCGISGLTVGLYRSSSGGGSWTLMHSVSTNAKGQFEFPQVRVTTKTFFRVTSVQGGGFQAANSNVVKIDIKR